MHHDFVVIGGGFFGCALALYLRSLSPRILLIESEGQILQRASRVNQARVHAGFHYPRSLVTANRSRLLGSRFVRDFPDAIDDQFDMLYAIARHGSKISAERFEHAMTAVGARFKKASEHQRNLFASDNISAVYSCEEYGFDWTALKAYLAEKLDQAGIETALLRTVTSVESLEGEGVRIHDASGGSTDARMAFNVTYGGLNRLAAASGRPALPLKFELAEIALFRPPEVLNGVGVTVMDGPFFSCMPFRSEGLHSLTHVRYTPHASWHSDDDLAANRAYDAIRHADPKSRWNHMMQDARRYVPVLRELGYERSLYEIKTVLQRNERDDGRPILAHRHDDRFFSIMGAKIDNIYDLFEVLPTLDPRLAGGDLSHLLPVRAG